MRNKIVKVKIQFVSIYSNSNSIRVYKVSMAILPQYHCPTLVPRPHSFHPGLPQDFLLFPTCQFSLLICLWWNLKTKVIDLKNRFPRDLLERPLNQAPQTPQLLFVNMFIEKTLNAPYPILVLKGFGCLHSCFCSSSVFFVE